MNIRYNTVPCGIPIVIFLNNLLFTSSRHQNGHLSSTNENVTFSKRNYEEINYPSYINDIDRSDGETTTEL